MGRTNDKSMLEFKAIETGGDPNVTMYQDSTPLQLAFMNPSIVLATIKALYEHGADMKVHDDTNCSILHLAAMIAA